ncbi:MAG: zinc transporter ZntB [Desulfobacteraceae bacterium]|nr:zinc transporter ZntB [Desulfobacteraceae bacterium]
MEKKSGLIFAYLLDEQGGGQLWNWEKVENWSPDQGLIWIHIDFSDDYAMEWLHKKSGLSEVVCEALVEEGTRPRINTTPDGTLIILRGVNCNPGADPDDMVGLRMLLSDRRIITMRQRRIMAVDDVRRTVETGDGPVSVGDFFVMVAERIVNRTGDVIVDIDDRVDEIEDSVLTGETADLRPKLADLRRQSISLRRYIAPQRDMLSRMLVEKVAFVDDRDRMLLKEIAERTARYVEDIDAARERAGITQEELNNRLSEQMNKAMYLLSIVAAIFLPLGLITGLLGINVGGIPGTENHLAFVFVTLGLVIVALALVAVFRRIKWL